MGIINLVELQPGMVLAEDVTNADGRLLVGRGEKLTSSTIRILKMWGVVEATVDGLSQTNAEKVDDGQQDPAIIQEAERAISERFRFNRLENQPMSELFHLCSLRKAKEISAGIQQKNQKSEITPEPHPNRNQVRENMVKKIDPHELIGNNINLPSLPAIYVQIYEVTQNPTSSANDIAHAISKDTSLSASLLRLVNSTFFGFPSKIDTLSRAVTILGTKQLSTLALGITILKVFKNIPPEFVDMRSFWEHSMACGIGARILASYKNIQNTERLFVAGLLHDIGRLLLYCSIPLHARNTLLRAKSTQSLLYLSEDAVMGFDHTEIGRLLLKEWKLPLSLENMVKHHHAPQESEALLEPAIIHMADIMANALEIGSSGERFVPPLDPYAWQSLGLSPNIFASTITQIDHQVKETTHFIFKNGQ